MRKNLKAFRINNRDYVWDFTKAKIILDVYSKKNKKYKDFIYEEISQLCFLTPGAVKNWFVRKNGPGELDYIIKMANYFKIEVTSMLNELDNEKESKIMEDFLEKFFESMPFEDEGLNLKTIKFLAILNELAEDSKRGYMGFKEYVGHHKYKGETLEELFDYEYTGEFEPGIIYDDEEGPDYGKIVMDMCVDFQHQDIVSTYDDCINGLAGEEYQIRVNDDDPENKYIYFSGKGIDIVIENGRWYWAGSY